MTSVSVCAACGRTAPEGAQTCPWDGEPLRPAPPPPPGEQVSGVQVSDIPEAALRFLPSPRPPAAVSQDAASGPDPLIGHAIGDFVIREQLGQGGMGIVYWGEQPVIGKRIAIKVLRPEIARDPEQIQRLLSEARAVNAIRHRGIIDIFNFGQLPDGRHYVTMELLSGIALDQLIARRGRIAPIEALEILDEVFSALAAGHEVGIIHRDLKPSNIFLVSQPDGSRYVKLLDFGLAKQSAVPRGATPQTRTDMFVGTPEYVAPEQARAELVGPYTDLYSAGVVAFEMLTGRLPFEATSPIEWVIRHLEAPPPPPSQYVPGLPPELDALLLSLLQKDATKRPPSAEAVREEIVRILGILRGGAGTPSVEPPTLPATSTLKSRAPLVGLFGLGGAALAAIGFAIIQSLPQPRARHTGTIPSPPSLDRRVAAPLAPVPEKPPSPTPGDEALAEVDPPAEVVASGDIQPASTTRGGEGGPSPDRDPPLRAETPSRRDLLREITRLEQKLRRQARGGVPPESLVALLENYREEARNAMTPKSRKELAVRLRKFDQAYLSQR